jgi:hypothetical protein
MFMAGIKAKTQSHRRSHLAIFSLAQVLTSLTFSAIISLLRFIILLPFKYKKTCPLVKAPVFLHSKFSAVSLSFSSFNLFFCIYLPFVAEW